MKNIIKQLYLKGHNEKEIFSIIKSNLYIDAEFNFKIENIEQYINKDLVKYKRNYRAMRAQRIKILYANGYNYKEIAKLIKDNTNTIKSFIFRNCQNERVNHLYNRRENKYIKKAIVLF